MISKTDFESIVGELRRLKWADEDIAWAEGLSPPEDAKALALETAWVICNSGMKSAVALGIFAKVRDKLLAGGSAHDVFGHDKKATAIDTVWRERNRLFGEFLAAQDQIGYLATIPFIGETTKYHLARNFGIDCVKPDVHLDRLAKHHATSPHDLCNALARETGFRIGTIDLLLWRACANGVIDSQTGKIRFDSTSARPIDGLSPR
jgi:hypothetical protein